MVLHFTIVNSLAELEQICQGFSFFKFNSLMKSHTELIKTARYLQDKIKAVLSPKGSVEGRHFSLRDYYNTCILYLKVKRDHPTLKIQ